MSPNETSTLLSALNTLGGTQIDYHNYGKDSLYNFEVIGKVVVAKRVLAEILGLDINQYLLPGESEFEDGDDKQDWQRFTSPSSSLELTLKEKTFLQKTLMPMLDKVSGVYDSDDACLRCVRRMIAEVSGYPDLSHYRLLREDNIKPLYFKQYTPITSSALKKP